MVTYNFIRPELRDEDDEDELIPSRNASNEIKKKEQEELSFVRPQEERSQQPETTPEAPEVKPVEEAKPSFLDRAKSAVRTVTDKIGLTDPEPVTPEAVQQNQELEKLKNEDLYKYTELVTVPALQTRIQEIDFKLATGEPDKQGIFPDLIPKIAEEKLANSIIGWATGNKNQGDQLRAERDYLQSLINGDVVSLEYQKKHLSNEEYNKVLAEQRISAVQEVKVQAKTDQVTLGTAQTTASLVDLGQLVGDQLGVETLSENSKEHSERLRGWSEAIRQQDEDFSDQLLQGFGSTIPFVLTGQVVGGIAKGIAAVSPTVASWFAAGTAGFLEAGSEAGAVYVEQKKEGKSQEEATTRANALFIANLGWNTVLNRFGLNSDEALGLKKIFYSSSMESIQEMGQQMGSNLASDRPIDEGLIESGIIGAVVGSGVSTLTGSGNVATDPVIDTGTIALGTQNREEEATEVPAQESSQIDVTNPALKNIVEEASQFQSAEDFATTQGTTVERQIGVLPAESITPRDTVDTTTDEYKALVDDIRTNGIKEAIIVSVAEDGTTTTFEGSHRVTAAREAGVEVPVIVTEGSIAGLPTIREFFESAQVQRQTPVTVSEDQGVRDMNRQFNQTNTNRLLDETLSGQRESFRMNTQENIYKAGTALGKDPAPDKEVIIYRAGVGSITPGSFVTTNKAVAQRYLEQREGSELQELTVKVSDLLIGGGLKSEFIYAPSESVSKQETQPEKAVETTPDKVAEKPKKTIKRKKSQQKEAPALTEDKPKRTLKKKAQPTAQPETQRTETPAPKGSEEIDVLPADVDIIEESKAVGAKRIAPDRIPHQQLTPEAAIKRLTETSKQELTDAIAFLEGKIATRGRLAGASKGAKESYDAIKAKIDAGETLSSREQNWYNRASRVWDDVIKSDLVMKYAPAKSASLPERLETLKSKLANLDEQVVKDYKELVRKDISKGYRYPPAVLDYDKSFRTAVDNRARYEKGLYTSFSADDYRIVFDDQNRIVGGMKRQDGKELTADQKNEIIEGVLQTQAALGINLNQLAKDERWVYAHLNEKNPFLVSNAGGLYRKDAKGNISVSVGGTEGFYVKEGKERIRKRVNTTMAHELGHALDFHVEQKLFPSRDLYELRISYNPVEISMKSPSYWSSAKEVTARAIQQYVAVKNGHTGTFKQQGLWSKEIFESKVAPMVEKAIEEKFAKYKIKPGEELPVIENPTTPAQEVTPEPTTPEQPKVKRTIKKKKKAATPKVTPQPEPAAPTPEVTPVTENQQRIALEQSIAAISQQVETLRSSGSTEIADSLEATLIPMQAQLNALLEEEAAAPNKTISTREGRRGAAQQPVQKTTGKARKSKYLTRVQERLSEEFRGDVMYNRLNSQEDSERAIEFVENNPERAERIARGLELPPEGIRQNSISIATAEKAKADGNAKLQAEIETALSLRATRQGQEIQALAGRMNETNPYFFVRQLLQSRIEKADRFSVEYKEYKKENKKSGKSEGKIMTEFVDKKAQAIKKEVRQKLSKVELAQQLIDSLTC